MSRTDRSHASSILFFESFALGEFDERCCLIAYLLTFYWCRRWRLFLFRGGWKRARVVGGVGVLRVNGPWVDFLEILLEPQHVKIILYYDFNLRYSTNIFCINKCFFVR
jgi:hypothetical protein